MTGDYRKLYTLLTPYLRSHRWLLLLLCAWLILETGLISLRPLIMAPLLNLILHPESAVPAAPIALSLSSLDLNTIGAAIISWLGLDPTKGLFHTALVLCVLFLGVTFISSFGSYAGLMLSVWIRQVIRREFELDLFRHMLNLPLKFHWNQKIGALVSRLEDDSGEVTRVLDTVIRNLLISPLLIVFYGTLMILTNPALAIAAAAGSVLHIILIKALEKPVRRASKHQYWFASSLQALLHETLLSIRVVKSFCAEETETARLQNQFRLSLRIIFYDAIIRNLQRPFRTVVDTLVQISITLLAVYELSQGRLTSEGFFLFIYVGMSTMGPISNLATTFGNFPPIFAAVDRVEELLGTKEALPDGRRGHPTLASSISFKNVIYRYNEMTALDGISLDIRKGETVALVGPSGGGKSTLADLLMRFDDPQGGTIEIDGVDIREYSVLGYRRLFRMVPQETLLFNATIRDNIAYSRANLSDEEIFAAARIANAEEFINALTLGYQTIVGDRGIKLSGGQRQRIALARAVVDHPAVLILDEATSALDSESEWQVQAAIDSVLKMATAVVIAHRLSTVMRADRIIVLDKGQIVDIGTHAELYSRCSLYQRLCDLQFNENLYQTPGPTP